MIQQGPMMEELVKARMLDQARYVKEDKMGRSIGEMTPKRMWRYRLGQLLVEKGMALQKT